jgi:hypothetical protein
MRRLLLIALAVLPLLVIATLPAGLVIPRFDPPAALGQYGGTIWSGQARWRQAGQAPMALQWRWTWPWRWQWEASDGVSQVTGLWQPSDGIDLTRIQGRLAVERLDLAAWLPLSPPQGVIELDLDAARLLPGRPPRVRGEAVWAEARLAGVVQEDLGRIRLRFEPAESAESTSAQRARVESLTPAAVLVDGSIEFEADAYRVDLWLQASPERPELAGQLGALGERQADGRVRLQLQGRLGLD